MSEDKKVKIMDEVKDTLPTEDVREGISEADVEVTVIDDRDIIRRYRCRDYDCHVTPSSFYTGACCSLSNLRIGESSR